MIKMQSTLKELVIVWILRRNITNRIWIYPSIDLYTYMLQKLLGSCPSRIQGTLRMNGVSGRERDSETKLGGWVWSLFLHGPFIPLTTSFLGGSTYCLHTGHLKTLQQLDFQQKQDVTHILFIRKSLSYHLASRPANNLWLAPCVT